MVFARWILLFGGASLLTATAGAQAPSLAVFHDVDVPVRNSAPSDPDYLARLAREAGWSVSFVTAADLADPQAFNRGRFEAVVLPYGESFPLKARENFRSFVKAGGSFFSAGGYAFNFLYAPGGGETENLLANGGFEQGTQNWKTNPLKLPPGVAAEAAEDVAKGGSRSARLNVEGSAKTSFYALTQEIPAPEAGARLRLRAWVRTNNLRDGGAYAALTFWHADGTRFEKQVRQTETVRDNVDWKQISAIAEVPKDAKAVRVGLLLTGHGEAWFDDVELTESNYYPLNTRLGFDTQAGSVHTRPDQIGVFDDGYPLREVAEARAAEAQSMVPAHLKITGPLEGWAAAAKTGAGPDGRPGDARRWVPLLIGYNAAGEEVGPVLSIVYNYNPPFAGSVWAFAGVTNRDLFAPGEAAMGAVFKNILAAMRAAMFLRLPETNYFCYRQGEPVTLRARAQSLGHRPREARLTLRAMAEDDGREVVRQDKALTIEPGKEADLVCEWKPPRFEDDFYTVEATLEVDGQVADRTASGFVVWSPDVVAQGFPLQWRDNYFHAGDRPFFFTGSDHYSAIFQEVTETPLAWRETFSAMRDHGLHALRVLGLMSIMGGAKGIEFDWSHPPEESLRRVDALIQTMQKYQIVLFQSLHDNMPMILPDKQLEQERQWAEFFARRYKDVPGLMFDIQNEPNALGKLPAPPPAYVTALYREFLKGRYGTDRAYAEANKDKELKIVEAELPPARQPWESRAGIDREEFAVEMLRRWMKANAEGVHSGAPDKTVTAGFLPQPTPADMWLASEFTDFSNFHAYLPYDVFRRGVKFIDQRSLGRGLTLGEYGVAVNPGLNETAHLLSGKAKPHWVAAAEDEWQRAIDWYVSVPLQSFAMGVGFACNWHLVDPDAKVFDFGLFHDGRRVPRTTLKSYRAASLLLRQFAPEYHAPSVYCVIPDSHRNGGGDRQAIAAAIQNALDLLIGCGVDFAVINETSLAQLPSQARLLFWPIPFCPDDAAVDRLVNFVEGGGTLVATGDFSYDRWRRRSRTERLKRLAGVEFAQENCPNIDFSAAPTVACEIPLESGKETLEFAPCIDVRPAGARTLLSAAGKPLLTEFALGKGRTYFTPEPYELRHEWNETALYEFILQREKVERMPARPLRPETPVLRQATRDGEYVYVLCNRSEAPAAIELTAAAAPVKTTVAPRREALVAIDKGREAIAACFDGEITFGGGRLATDARAIVLSADKTPLASARRLAVFLLGAKQIEIASMADWKAPAAELGEIVDGRWKAFDGAQLSREGGALRATVPEVHRYKMLLIAEPDQMGALRTQAAGWIMP